MLIAVGAMARQPVPAAPMMLFFDWGKPDIRSDDQAVLDQAAAAWRANPNLRLQLSGHTDRSGSAVYNLRASRRRVEMVKAELVKRGVPANVIATIGYGEERPLVPTEDGVREVQNRRVEILITDTSVLGTVAMAPLPIVGPAGEPRGLVNFAQDGRQTIINIVATGLPLGMHGIHLHAVGRCEGPDFKSAGGHWNPMGKQHGRDNPAGAHLGDLPNLVIGADGRGSARLTVDGDVADADGTSLVIHAKEDDYKTDPSGNSGDRVACAVLAAPKSP
jgi:Cu-Zn family superoxide dismutase